jgi:D-alanyl-D-alanine carboxypeptidase
MLFEQIESGRFKLSTELPVSREAASQSPSKLGLRPGETISVEDAIKALVTKSANDVAVVVAEAIGGDEERFGQMMTRKARSIGMARSVFRNASGLPNPAQVTTARDLVILGKAIQDRFPRYYSYFGTRTFHYEGHAYRNHNRLLGNVEGVDGIKTGYTRASGFNLLTSAKADGRHLITVVLGGRSARIRDQQVASLIENHMDRAYAGRRMTAKVTEVAQRDQGDEDEEEVDSRAKPAPALPPARVAAASPVQTAAPVGLMAQPTALPQPPARPRPAVISETGPRMQQGADPGLTRQRPVALSATGAPSTVQSATTPLALVSPPQGGQPAMRWNTGPLPTEPAPVLRGEERLVPPGKVRYTNTIPGEAPNNDEAQPLPQRVPEAPVKAEDRLPSMANRAQIAATTPLAVATPPKAPVTEAPKVAAIAPVKVEPAKVDPPKTTAPARSGWIIQIAAAESDAKARAVLDNAREKTGRLLKDAEPFTESVSKGGSTLYRARFAGFEAEEAQNACKALKRAGFNCIAQKI